ncbi:MAG: hypothetical protein AAFZ07_05245 [Actinomycetota bacterium]
MLRRGLAALAAALLCLAGCGGDDAVSEPPESAAVDCRGPADRWARIQQGYLDRISDADLDELTAGSPRIDEANEWFGPAMIEQVRDAAAVGCDDEFVAGSPLLCARLDGLEPAGEAGERVVADLDASCGGG